MAEDCVSRIPGVAKLIADKGYDTDALRSYLKEQAIKPGIPGKSNRKTRVRYDKLAYKIATSSSAASVASRTSVAAEKEFEVQAAARLPPSSYIACHSREYLTNLSRTEAL